jgi:hypothetical protein
MTDINTRILERGSVPTNTWCHDDNALLTVLKKWTFARPMTRGASGRHVFEANVNRFALLLQVHGAKPLDDLTQQASIRQG